MKRESFVFRGEWKDAIADLPAGVRLEIYEAVIEYGTSGTIPALKQMAMLAFNFMKTAIDRDRERYEDAARERSEKARRNATARWSNKDADVCDGMQTMQPHANDATACDCMQPHNEMQPHANDAIYVYDSVNVEEEKEPKGSKKKAASAAERAEVVIKAATDALTDEVMATSYPNEMKEKFIAYWTEPNKSRTRVRYQMEKTWDTSRRLALWASRDNVKPQPKATEIGRKEFSRNYEESW